MTNPTELNAFSTLPAEVQVYIIGYAGNPAVTSLVSRSWQAQTRAVVKSELRQIFQYLNPGQPFNPAVDLSAIKELYKQTLQLVPQDIAPHLPSVSLEKFLEMEAVINPIKIRDTLALWSRLPGGGIHILRESFEGLSLTEIREQLKSWIEKSPGMQVIPTLNLRNSNFRYLPPEIGQLTHFQTLYLSRNQLTALPPEIGQLTNLQTLFLNQNQLTALPPEIGQLTNLQRIYLHQNPLTKLPETLSNSNVEIHLWGPSFIKASTAYQFFLLSPEQKNAVYGRIYHLAKNAGVNIESWDTQYGKTHVFDSEERLVAAMSEL